MYLTQNKKIYSKLFNTACKSVTQKLILKKSKIAFFKSLAFFQFKILRKKY